MSRAREITLTFFVMYLSPLKLSACVAKIDFYGRVLQKSILLISDVQAGVEHWVSSEVYLMVALLEKPIHNAIRHFS